VNKQHQGDRVHPKSHDQAHCQQFDSVNYWYWDTWKVFPQRGQDLIVQGIAVFLSLFETIPMCAASFALRRNSMKGRLSILTLKERSCPHLTSDRERQNIGPNFPVPQSVLPKTSKP